MKFSRVLFSAAIALALLSPVFGQTINGGGGVTPTSNCADASHACGFTNGAWYSQAITGGTAAAGGSNTQLQYNQAGALGGITGATTNGTVVTLTSPVLVTPALGTPASGVATNLTGTAAGLTSGNVTTNANLTGVITSSGNATSIASQTGTGTKFVVDTSPTLVTPNLGTPSAVVLTHGTGLVASTGLTATGTPSVSTCLLGNDTWGSCGAGGGVTSVATGACLTGGPITTTGTISGTYVIDPRTTTSEAITAAAACKLVTFNNGGATAASLVQATGSAGAGFSFDVQNLGAGLVTITPTTSTINGASTLTIAQNTGCTITSDGTNYQISACTAKLATGSGTVTSIATNAGLTGGTITTTGTIGLAAIAADNLLANSTGSSAAPIATSIGSCSSGANALTYNTSTHAFGCNTISGSGTVNSGTSGQVAYYASSTAAVSGSANMTITTGALTLGASGTLGSVEMGNATSGTVKVQPVTGALGSVTASLPANTGTIAELNLNQNFTAEQDNCVTTLSINNTTHFTPDGTCNNYIIVLTSACASAACTLDNWSTTRTGASGWIKIVQPSSGGPAAFGTYGSQLQAPGGTSTITYSTAANAVDLWSYANLSTTLTAIVPGGLAFAH